MSDAVESVQPDHDKMAEIQSLLMESDAGNIQYDREGNPIYSDEMAEAAHQKAVKEDREAQGGIAPETEQVTTETEVPQEIEQEKEEKPKTVNYDDSIEIPLPDGRDTLTLGELKDRYVEQARTREALETAQSTLATERMIVNEILREGGEVTEERISQLRQINEAAQARDEQTILQMYPQWANQETRQRDVEAMVKTAADLGATNAEIAAVSKPWIVRMLKDLSDYRAREARGKTVIKPVPMAEAKAKKAAPETPQSNTPASQLGRLLTEAKDRESADWHGIDQLLRTR